MKFKLFLALSFLIGCNPKETKSVHNLADDLVNSRDLIVVAHEKTYAVHGYKLNDNAENEKVGYILSCRTRVNKNSRSTGIMSIKVILMNIDDPTDTFTAKADLACYFNANTGELVTKKEIIRTATINLLNQVIDYLKSTGFVSNFNMYDKSLE